MVTRVPGVCVQSAAVYAVQLAFGAPGGASEASRGHLRASPDEKGSIFDHLGVFLVSKMAFLRSGTDPICFKFESDALKMKEF